MEISFNPLHCGAVVASGKEQKDGVDLFVSIPFIAGQWSLQRALVTGRPVGLFVSIPFIAGQWSLLAPRLLLRNGTSLFQSPSLRGSGRFPMRRIDPSF